MWIDAFTPQPMSGNPCVVVFDADEAAVETRIALVRETGLSECAYLVHSDKADFGARYYLATGEILMAGHPTVATCRALDEAGMLAGRERFTLEIGAGVIEIAVRRGAGETVYTMTQPAPTFGRDYAPAEIAALYGLKAGDIVGTPRTVSTGTAYCIAVLRDLEALRRARLDLDAFRDWQPASDCTEPFLCVTQGFTGAGDTAARLLLPPPLPAEDSFTGSATGAMAAYLWANGLIGSARFSAEQGHWMGRPGRGEVEVLGPPDAISGVRLGGPAALLMDGRVRL